MLDDSKNENKMRYVSDKIGDIYEKWGIRDIILITAPTGRGKSHFILHIFLKWIKKNGWKLLYLVNRKILKEQLEEELGDVRKEIIRETGNSECCLKNYIKICTYQSIEKSLSDINKAKKTLEFLTEFNCVVCDECHYFYSDSNFNTNTELSFLTIYSFFTNGIQIYISATPEKVTKKIKHLIEMEKKALYDRGSMTKEEFFHPPDERIKNYDIQNDYDYIDFSAFEKMEDLFDIIELNLSTTKEKWLVFVDNIDAGIKLKNDLKSFIKQNKEKKLKEDVVFLDANYDKEEESQKSVEQIVKEKISSKRVIISTAVMDNGVSLIDLELKNIAIFTDTKEQFIQMLGRKRENGEKVNLYVCKQNIKHFRDRRNGVNSITEYYYDHENSFLRLWHPYEYNGIPYSYAEFLSFVFFHGVPFYDVYFEFQQEILSDLLSNNMSSQHIKKLCYSVNGCIVPNRFSIDRLNDLYGYYEDMITKLENDEYAFVKEQASWLGIPEEKLSLIISRTNEDLKTKNRNNLENCIKKILGNEKSKKISTEENKEWKHSVKDYFIYFLSADK